MTTPKNQPTDNTANREIIQSRVFDAPRELVWEAMTDPEHAQHWWGPNGFTLTIHSMEVREGGAWKFVMHGPDGTDYDNLITYREVVRPARLVYAHGSEARPEQFQVKVTLSEEDGKTRLTMRSIFPSVEACEAVKKFGAVELGKQTLARLSELLPKMFEARRILISRLFDAPRELIWDAMTDPKKVINWWGPRGFTTTVEEMDVRVGGAWKLVMHGPDGTNYPNKSIFTEVVKPERIVYSHGGGKAGGKGAHFVATWSFEIEGDKTRVTISMLFPSAADRDFVVKEYGAIEGGKQTLGRLSELLAREAVVLEREFDAPVERVWQALTNFDEMKQWYFPNLEAFKAEVGFETQFNIHHAGKDFLHIWKVTEVVPGKKIAYSWKYGGNAGESVLTFELSPVGNRTRLKLTHAGLETFQPENNPNLARGNFLKGWTGFMEMALPGHLAKN